MTLCIPDNFVFFTTMNTRLFNTVWNISKDNALSFPNVPFYFYHENSFEKKEYGEFIDIENSKYPNNVIFLDLFEENSWLENFLKTSPFKDCYKTTEEFRRNSPFWFRKVVCISSFIQKMDVGKTLIWMDCDAKINSNFPIEFFEYINKFDWLVIFRERAAPETGFQIIHVNEKTKQFAKKYLDFYLSGEVFKQRFWADHDVLGICIRKYFNELKVGGLTPKFDCPIDIYRYILHYKHPLVKVRSAHII